jgi:hypothetical protein
MEVDVQQIGLALSVVHEVAVPDLLWERHRRHFDIPTFWDSVLAVWTS